MSFRLLDLPPELRRKIFGFYFAEPNSYPLHLAAGPEGAGSRALNISLFLVSRQLHQEGLAARQAETRVILHTDSRDFRRIYSERRLRLRTSCDTLCQSRRDVLMGYHNLTLFIDLSSPYILCTSRDLEKLLDQLDERIQSGAPFMKSLQVCVREGWHKKRSITVHPKWTRTRLHKLLIVLITDRPCLTMARFCQCAYGPDDMTFEDHYIWPDDGRWMNHSTFISEMIEYDSTLSGIKSD